MKARGGDSARSDDISACSARLGSPDSPTAVGAFARFSDGQTASSFTSDTGDLAFAAAQQQHMGTQLGTEANEEQLAEWEIPEHQLRCSRLWDGHMDAQPAAPARLLWHPSLCCSIHECMAPGVVGGSVLVRFGCLKTCHGVRCNRICKRADGKLWLLGEGSYGKVWKAVWTKPDGAELDVAMKMTIISPGGHSVTSVPPHHSFEALPTV